MIHYLVLALFVLILAGCSTKDKVEVPKDPKPGPTTHAQTIEEIMKSQKK